MTLLALMGSFSVCLEDLLGRMAALVEVLYASDQDVILMSPCEGITG